MAAFLVAGLINVETTLRVTGFPLHYNPVNYPFFGVNSSVAGVGYNVAKALAALGNDTALLSLLGDDAAGEQVRIALARDNLPAEGVLVALEQTPQSVILYDPAGRRQIHTDLKDVQERAYPPHSFLPALAACGVAVLCNVNFTRPFLAPARAAGKLVASDVHALADLDDPYNGDYMRAAHVLFLSHERLPVAPEEFAQAILGRFAPEVCVIGLGAEGALLATRAEGVVGRFPAAVTRTIVSTVGAGDALFASFLDGYARTRDARASLRRAILFASWKIGVASASEGFLDAAALDSLAEQW